MQKKYPIANQTMAIQLAQSKESILKQFIEFMQLEHVSHATIKSYCTQVKAFSNWCCDSGVNIIQATIEDIKRYRAFLSDDKHFTRSTVAIKLASVRRLYSCLLEKGITKNNPASLIKMPKDNEAREDKVKFITAKQAIALLNSIKTNTKVGKRDKAMLALMLIHGLRSCEITSLKLDNVESNKIRVLGKGNKFRNVYLIPQTEAILKNWLKVRNSSCEYVFFNLQNGGIKKDGITTRGIEKITKKYLAIIGINKNGICCHSLRHSAATLSLANGATIQQIQSMLGHASITTTEVYAKVIDKEKNNPALKLDFLFK